MSVKYSGSEKNENAYFWCVKTKTDWEIMMWNHLLCVGIGGFLGSVSRYGLSLGMVSLFQTGFPVATLAVNALGSFLIGILLEVAGSGNWFYLGVTGFCGGFTTFSTFSAESLALFRQGDHLPALAYIVLSVVLCISAVWAGTTLAVRLR